MEKNLKKTKTYGFKEPSNLQSKVRAEEVKEFNYRMVGVDRWLTLSTC